MGKILPYLAQFCVIFWSSILSFELQPKISNGLFLLPLVQAALGWHGMDSRV